MDFVRLEIIRIKSNIYLYQKIPESVGLLNKNGFVNYIFK